MITMSPYMGFDGNAREAMETYQSIFGGDLRLMPFGEAAASMGADPEAVMHGQLDTPHGVVLMGADSATPGELPPVGNVTICIWGDDSEQMHAWFTCLAEGGEITMPLEKQMWGDEYGSVTDRFGQFWGFNVGAAEA